MSTQGLEAVQELDRLASDAGVVLSVGPVLTEDGDVPGFASWATDLVQSTAATSFSSFVATPEHGVHPKAVRAAAEAVSAIIHAVAVECGPQAGGGRASLR